jgi:hypothetical protein
MASQNGTNVALNAIKVYIFPTLVTILSMMIWRDITEMRADVKMLLAQSNIDKTKIEQLERTVKSLEMTVFDKKPIAHTYLPWFMKLYFKPEEYYDINKNIISEFYES